MFETQLLKPTWQEQTVNQGGPESLEQRRVSVGDVTAAFKLVIAGLSVTLTLLGERV